jgi:hypothetical protein
MWLSRRDNAAPCQPQRGVVCCGRRAPRSASLGPSPRRSSAPAPVRMVSPLRGAQRRSAHRQNGQGGNHAARSRSPPPFQSRLPRQRQPQNRGLPPTPGRGFPPRTPSLSQVKTDDRAHGPRLGALVPRGAAARGQRRLRGEETRKGKAGTKVQVSKKRKKVDTNRAGW